MTLGDGIKPEELYARLLDVSPDAIMLADVEGNLLSVNQQALKLLGYDSAEEIVGKSGLDLVAPEDRQRASESRWRALEGDTVTEMECSMLRKDGTRFPARVNISAIKARDGTPGAVIAVVRDLTQRRQTEQQLRLYMEVVSNSSEAIAILDSQGKYIEQNDAHQELIGYSDEELAEKTPAVHLGEEQFAQVLEDLAATGRYRGELVSRTKSGTDIHIELAAFALKDDTGRPVCYAGIKRDITRRKQAEDALQARARQQAAVAMLGQRALSESSLATLFEEAVALVADTLGVEYVKVLELLPDGEFLLQAGVGWQPGLVGTARLSAGHETQSGYTLLSGQPVIVDDLRTETRFSGPSLLHSHGVVSGMSAVIKTRGRQFGVLGAHTSRHRRFTQDDTHFLQGVANVLAAAIERSEAEQERARLLAGEQAARAESEAAQRRLKAQYDVSSLLAESPPVPQAMSRALQAIGETLAWDVGTLWTVDREVNRLYASATWHASGFDPGEFFAITRQVGTAPGEDAPGRVWASGESVWISDVLIDGGFVRGNVAALVGLHTAALFPIRSERAVLGVMEFLSRQVRLKDEALLQPFAIIGNEICQFVERKEAEERVKYQASLLDMVEQAVIATDTEGRVVYWNRHAEKLYGWATQEALGRPALDLTHAEISRGEATRILARVTSGESWSGEFTARRRDGAAFPVLETDSPIYIDLGEVVGIVSVSTDISERRRMEMVIRDLSTPVLQIRERLLLAPIIGIMDPERATQLTNQLLAAIRAHRARVVVIDITGVAVMDSYAANYLLRTVEASRLLGAHVIVTGLSPDIAQTLVKLGVDLGKLRTVGDLQGGIEEAERLLGYEMVSLRGPGVQGNRP